MKQTIEEKKRSLSKMRLHKISLLTAARLTMIALLSVSFGLTQCGGGGNDTPEEYPYVCANGTATVGTSTTQNEQNCTSCSTGWMLNATTNTCDGNSYTCTNGVAADGMPTSDGEVGCASCDTGYVLTDSDACEVPTGAASHPYVITTYAELLCMGRAGTTTSGENCSSYAAWTLAKHYRLGQNIDANASCPNYDGTNGDTVTCGLAKRHGCRWGITARLMRLRASRAVSMAWALRLQTCTIRRARAASNTADSLAMQTAQASRTWEWKTYM